jgi:hypothetical protein
MTSETARPSDGRLSPWGPWIVRVLFLSSAIALPVAQWPTSRMGAGFLLVCGLALTSSTAGLRPLWLRLVRLVAGGGTTVAGAVLTLQMGWMLDHPSAGDPEGLSGALTIAVVLGGLGVWIADLRITQAAEAGADKRQGELLAALANPPQRCEPRTPTHAPTRAFLLVVAALLWASKRRHR